MLGARLSYLCSGSRHSITLESLEQLLRSSLGQPGLSPAQELHSVPNNSHFSVPWGFFSGKAGLFHLSLAGGNSRTNSFFPLKTRSFQLKYVTVPHQPRAAAPESVPRTPSCNSSFYTCLCHATGMFLQKRADASPLGHCDLSWDWGYTISSAATPIVTR